MIILESVLIYYCSYLFNTHRAFVTGHQTRYRIIFRARIRYPGIRGCRKISSRASVSKIFFEPSVSRIKESPWYESSGRRRKVVFARAKRPKQRTNSEGAHIHTHIQSEKEREKITREKKGEGGRRQRTGGQRVKGERKGRKWRALRRNGAETGDSDGQWATVDSSNRTKT